MTGERVSDGGEAAPSAAMDDDVAAILGLTPLELKRGVGAFGWIESVGRASWAPTAAAILLPAVIAAAVAFTLLPEASRRPVAATEPAPDAPMAMRAGSAPAAPANRAPVLAAGPEPLSPPAAGPVTAVARGEDRPVRAQRANAEARPAPTPERDRQVVVAQLDTPRRVEQPIEVAQARYTDLAEDPVRRQIVAARLDAVDALRALRQK